MTAPTKYGRDYSFSGYQETNPADPLPGDRLDIELDNIAESLGLTIDALADVRAADGSLKNGIVDQDSLADDVLDAFQDQVDAATAQADAAAASASAAAGSASTASTAASTASSAASSASSSASSASTSASTASSAASTATTKASEASSSASTASTAASTATTKASEAASSASAASTSAGNASTSETNAAASASSAASSYDSFDDRYLGAKSSAPTLDNDGNALIEGALYFDSVLGAMYVRHSGAWVAAYVPDGAYAVLASSNIFQADQTIRSADAGATVGPVLTLYRDSASPAASDLIGSAVFSGRDSAGNAQTYASIGAVIVDPTSTSEDATLDVWTVIAGTLAVRGHWGAGLYTDGVTGGDKGAGTVNAGTVYEAGTALSAKYAALSGATPATFVYADNGALVGPTIGLYRDSASPAASDLIGRISWQGRDSAANVQDYAYIGATITDPTSGSEDAALDVWTVVAGTLAARGHWGAGFYSDGVTGGDKGAGTLNFTTIYEGGTLLAAKYAQLGVGATFTQPMAITLASAGGLQITAADDGAGGTPDLSLIRTSASPAASDVLGRILLYGLDSGANQTVYASIQAKILDATDTSEDGALEFRTMVAGSAGTRFAIAQGLYTVGQSDMGTNTINATTLYEAGTSLSAKYAQLGASNAYTAGATYTLTSGSVAITTTQPGTVFSIASTDASATVGPRMVLYRNSASPAAADSIGQIAWRGKDSGANDCDYTNIESFILDATDGSEDASLILSTFVAGSIVAAMSIANGVIVGSPTGSYKGTGTLNATAVYDDNTLLTCFVLEAARTGAIDVDAWDARVPNRVEPAVVGREVVKPATRIGDAVIEPATTRDVVIEPAREVERVHEPARDFAANRMDELDARVYAEKWWQTGVLPGFKSPDEWAAEPDSAGQIINRLWATVELLAVHNRQLIGELDVLKARVEALEAA